MCESPARCTITEHGLRCTNQRERVLDALRQAHDHPTADELHERLEAVSLATVYNALEAFARVGLAQPIAVSGGLTRWDPEVGLHAHVRRGDTDALEDMPEDLAKGLLAGITPRRLDAVARRLGGRVRGVQISVLLDGDESDDAGEDGDT